MRLDKEIVLKDRRYMVDGGFIVKRLINSVVYRVGGSLSEEEVKRLCSLPLWTVTIEEDS